MPQRLRSRLRNALLIYLFFAYGAAWATISAVEPDLLSLPWAQAFVGVAVSWVGGFAASLGRMVTASYNGTKFRSVYEFSRDGAVSVVIGLGGYLGGMSQAMSPAMLALVLLLGGYAGTKTLAVWVDRMLASPK